jgi:hypothetical protein
MPGKRTTELPLGDQVFDNLVWNPFFDESVQSVLKTRKEIEPASIKFPRKGTNSLLLAWPIIAFKETIGAVYWTAEAHEGNFFAYFDWDNDFVANLFMAVTRYKTLPAAQWNLRRALVECPRQYQSPETQQRMARGEIEGLVLQEEPYDWTEIADMIAKNLPHLKTPWTSAENLRKQVFYKARRDRLKIVKDWETNLDVYKRWEVRLNDSAFDWSSLPCHPQPDYYKRPSVTQKLRKK